VWIALIDAGYDATYSTALNLLIVSSVIALYSFLEKGKLSKDVYEAIASF